MSTTKGFTIWLTGLSGTGKTTIGLRIVDALRARGRNAELLDGDELRATLSKGLGFTRDDRDEHVRRIGFVAEILTRNGVVAVVAAISPYRSTREEVRARLRDFVEVHLRCSMPVLERRDPKGLYAKARAGQIARFTGVSDPYEDPLTPEIVADTDRDSVDVIVERVLAKAEELGQLTGPST